MDNKQLLDNIINAKRIISNNVMLELDKNDPNYIDIMMGGHIIWSKYYKRVMMKTDTYENVVNNLNIDSNNNKYIIAYVNKFGNFWRQ